MQNLRYTLIAAMLLMAVLTPAIAEPPFDPPSWCEKRWGTDHVKTQKCVERLNGLSVKQLAVQICELRYTNVDECVQGQIKAYAIVKEDWNSLPKIKEAASDIAGAKIMSEIFERCIVNATNYGDQYDYHEILGCTIQQTNAALALGKLKN